MARFLKDRIQSKGKAPGSLILIGNQKMEKTEIKLIEYDAENLMEKDIENIDEVTVCKDHKNVSWINFYGIHDLEIIKRTGDIFDLHHLLLEDILNTDQMPKYESGDTYEAVILKMLHYGDDEKIVAEQITLILGENYVMTFQEQRGDVFNPVRERIRSQKGRVRLNENDYLAYTLLDCIIDNYILLIEKLGRKIERLDEYIFHNSDKNIAEQIYAHKTEINFLRNVVRPVKEIIKTLVKAEDTFFQPKNLGYLNDLNDNINQAAEAIELYGNILSDQLNMYNSNVSNKMNEVMKVLTIFASIFIPLTFIAGIYGMNFHYMPELGYRYSYPIFWGATLSILIILIIYFKRKKWF